jgi:LAO/AO transport system kinase
MAEGIAKKRGAEAQKIAASVRRGDRRGLARAITLIESTRADHRALADEVIGELLPHTGKSMRVGISGPPGVGKSTLIECLGLQLVAAGHKVAVLAVDPSSRISGGSILGDKTRMSELARAPKSFIRPSPASGTLGGVARRTREAMLACEAAGFDVILVETVGVGQSEVAVVDLVDLFWLLVPPAGGDDLQGIKRGIVELADLITVTKADGELKPACERAAADYGAALRLLRGPEAPRVRTISGRTGAGVAQTWQTIEAELGRRNRSGALARTRKAQARAWLWSEINESLAEGLRQHAKVKRLLPELEAEVAQGRTTPAAAAATVLALYRGPD